MKTRMDFFCNDITKEDTYLKVEICFTEKDI